MIIPATASANEYEAFSLTFIIDPVPLTLSAVSITSSDGKDYSSFLATTIHNTFSFTVAGTLSDIFDREMEYLDKNDNMGIVSRFEDIPNDFNTLYRYKGATINSITLTVTATTDTIDEVATITINNNYNVANSKLVDYVSLGKF